ncbi:dihydrofolate reductase family protein [Bacillus horti]|uniref:Dihydrofolate reductase n=1 Tax=Caldalkalibacillus horti TaxID=77523 RepID=A0ABT9VU48_9BACI|nr:dihydrofolate reductase family protein [Bacillus horti]MDQ0164511.1 dihydrofolate reductase [Bacillus horti]
MGKLISQMMVSIDNFIEGPNQELDWHVVDSEYNEYAEAMLYSVDAIFFGRITYEHMAGFWTTDFASEHSPVIAEKLNQLPKVVFSTTLEEATWSNTSIIKQDIEKEILALKQSEKNLIILGSSDLVSSLTELGLIDEYHIIVNPIILGSGKPLFKGLGSQKELSLIEAKTFQSGNVLLRYSNKN